MRLFVAIELPDDVKDELSAFKVDGRRTKRDQLHLTLRFIGDGVEVRQFAVIKQALAQVKAAPFTIQFRGVGQFPSAGKGQRPKPARVLWAGIDDNPALNALQQKIESALSKAGVTPADHPFSAHITLARNDPPRDATPFLEAHHNFESRVLPVEHFVLFSSVLAPHGATHKAEVVYKLNDS